MIERVSDEADPRLPSRASREEGPGPPSPEGRPSGGEDCCDDPIRLCRQGIESALCCPLLQTNLELRLVTELRLDCNALRSYDENVMLVGVYRVIRFSDRALDTNLITPVLFLYGLTKGPNCVADKLASLNSSWQSNKGTFRSSGLAGIELMPSQSRVTGHRFRLSR
jgi:hypothetical protein